MRKVSTKILNFNWSESYFMKNTSAIYVVDDDLMITIHLKHQLESCFGEESNLIIETFQEPEIALKTIQENKDLGVCKASI